MADRKAELERKKESLRQMREEKERRKREKEKADADSAALAIKQAASAAGGTSAPASTTASKGTGPLPPSAEVRETIDQVLKDIGIAPVGSVLDSMDRLPASTGPASTNSIFFCFLFVKKPFDFPSCKSITPSQRNTILFRSSQQLPCLRLGPLTCLVHCCWSYRDMRTPSSVRC